MTLFAWLSPETMIVVGLIALLLFGNRLPGVMRSLGQGVTEFKKGLEGGPEDDANENRGEEVGRPASKKLSGEELIEIAAWTFRSVHHIFRHT